MRDSKLIRGGLTALALVHLIAQLIWWFPHRLNEYIDTGDIQCYYHGATAILNHLPLYDDLSDATPSTYHARYIYWPQTAVVLSPLACLSLTQFSQFWYCLMLVSFWLFAGSLAKIATGRLEWRVVLLWGLALACMPVTYTIMDIGNIDPLLWALLGLAFASKRTAALLACVAQVKTYAVPAALLYLWEHRSKWHEVLIVAAAGFSLSFIAGLQWPLQWIKSVSPIAHQGTFLLRNWSLSMDALRIARLLGWDYHPGQPLPHWGQMLLTCSAAVIEIVALALCLRIKEPMRYTFLILLSALAQPLCWGFYMTPAIILVAQWIATGPALLMKRTPQPVPTSA